MVDDRGGSPHPRLLAGLAALATVVGVGLVTAAVVGTRRLWWHGYVSEAGVASQAQSGTYRAGMYALAAGLVLLGLAVWRAAPRAGLLLGVAALAAGGSGSVSCSEGCPLPPYESASFADLVHAAASVLAVGAVGLAMLVLGFGPVDTPLRRLSRLSSFVVVPLVGAVALAMLTLGRGSVTGLLERAALLSVAGWSLVAALRLWLVARRE